MIEPAASASLSVGQKEAAPTDHGSAGDAAHFFDAKQPASSALSASASMATLHQAAAQRHAHWWQHVILLRLHAAMTQ